MKRSNSISINLVQLFFILFSVILTSSLALSSTKIDGYTITGRVKLEGLGAKGFGLPAKISNAKIVRVDVSARNRGKIQAALTETRRGLTELVLEPLREELYYEIREPFSILSLLKSPMGLMMGFMLVVVFLMPKLMENMGTILATFFKISLPHLTGHLLKHLKTIEIVDYRVADEDELHTMRYLLENAISLKKMKIAYHLSVKEDVNFQMLIAESLLKFAKGSPPMQGVYSTHSPVSRTAQCNNGCFGCLEEERVALLEFKSSLKFNRTDPDYSLSTWIDDKGSDCCAWDRVECDKTTHRVINLCLGCFTYMRLSGNPNDYELFLNASLFLPFEELQELDLSENGFGGWEKNEGPQKLSKLRKLESLDLSYNNFGNNILPPFGALTSLNLCYSLRIDLWNMSKLKYLDLSLNNFSGIIPPSIWSLKSLEEFAIQHNNFKGSISGLCELKNLRRVSLANNTLQGNIPLCLSNFTSLTGLDLSDNQLTFVSLPNPKFQLTYLDLSNCNINASTSDLKFLHAQYNLTTVALSHNKLHGNFPSWLVENNTRLEYLFLRNNSLNGHIRLPAIHNLDWLDLSDNCLQGKLQTNIGGHLSGLNLSNIFFERSDMDTLSGLNLSHNFLEGRIPLSLGNIQDIDLSNNRFSGEIPHNFGTNASNIRTETGWVGGMGIKNLWLSNNKLAGPLSFLWNLTDLRRLHVNNNQFTGTIPAIPELYYLERFEASQNCLSGRIPAQIGNWTKLNMINLRDNHFDGPIPQELCKLPNLELLELSENQFSGSIPSGLNLSSLRYMQWRENKLVGMIPKALLRSRDKIATLDLSNNNLSGRIPKWFGLLSQLRFLLLKGNHFSGSIPHKFCQLNKMRILDLSHNSFSGSIPPCFGNFTFGNSGVDEEYRFGHLSLSFNRIGKVWFGEYVFDKVLRAYLNGPEEVELVTKNRPSLYNGDILNYMAGMDLSWNQFTGNIPVELGSSKSNPCFELVAQSVYWINSEDLVQI
ncbi:hypothetical protein IFM89_033183 [Coptis chinensis]|uniref:FBD domain-containing protein n=1 Tax=Coptis chinensis TaxID=261450 RepID=A0A835M2C6_9MAGN|nr:hypothetical protein IFM89_033183 [Coptis chinensis]